MNLLFISSFNTSFFSSIFCILQGKISSHHTAPNSSAHFQIPFKITFNFISNNIPSIRTSSDLLYLTKVYLFTHFFITQVFIAIRPASIQNNNTIPVLIPFYQPLYTILPFFFIFQNCTIPSSSP